MVGLAARALLTLGLAAATPPPNVLFIVVDDLAPVLSTYGHPALVTPNFERLAAQSVQFERAYVSVAVCAPSRTAFLTGLRPDQTNCWTIGPYFRASARGGQGLGIVTLPQLFKDAGGYNVSGSGKVFHPGSYSGGPTGDEGGADMCPADSPVGDCPARPGVGSWSSPYWFCDQFTNDTVQSPRMQAYACATPDGAGWPSCGGGCAQDAECVACFEAAGTWGVGGLVTAATDCPDRCYPEGIVSARVAEVLAWHAAARAAAAADAAERGPAPFFHAVGFKRPHLTYHAPRAYFELYDEAAIALPSRARAPPSMPPIAYSHHCMRQLADDVNCADPARRDGLCTETITNATVVRALRRGYYASVSLTDAHLGAVLDALDATGLSSSTVVTLLGDHGYQNGEKGEWCKSTTNELGTRAPMYVRMPLADPRRAAAAYDPYLRGFRAWDVVESVDLYPTLAELAGLDAAPTRMALAGESLVPLLLAPEGRRAAAPPARNKTWALSQWARRPSCPWAHSCVDGSGDPFDDPNDLALMGYALRTERWRYTAWFEFDWVATRPVYANVSARELYDHADDVGDAASGEAGDWDNLADAPEYAETVAALHAQLVAIIEAAAIDPLI